MDHQGAARAAVVAIVGIRVPNVKGQVIPAGGIHTPERYEVETFRALTISGLELWPQMARKRTDVVDLEQLKPTFVFHPQLKLSGLLDNPDEDRSPESETIFAEGFFQAWFDPLDGCS